MQSNLNRGFIRTIVSVVAALLVLKFVFHIDPATLWQNPKVQSIYNTINDWNNWLWDTYIWRVIHTIWDKIKEAWIMLRQIWNKLGEFVMNMFNKSKVYKE